MHLRTRNVNTAFRDLVFMFTQENLPGATSVVHERESNHGGPQIGMHGSGITRRPSRNGDVLMIDEPVTITYTHPRERVLFNSARDANPFFHLYESLWMLAGRNDVAPLAYYCKQFKEYSDDGKTLNGAYGYRWRYGARYEGVAGDMISHDQLNVLVHHLKADPTSRRAVLQMWTVEDDLLKIGRRCTRHPPGLSFRSCSRCGGTGIEPGSFSRDVCCNLSVMFSLRETHPLPDAEHVKTEGSTATMRKPKPHLLDMTVTNRSNDLLWGLLGANYVHFTVLQEYLAARLGAEVGLYHHFTNNLHVYKDRKDWRPEGLLADKEGDRYRDNWLETTTQHNTTFRTATPLVLFPLVHDPDQFELELLRIVRTYSGDDPERRTWAAYSEPFFADVATPMFQAFFLHKQKDAAGALREAALVRADDWRLATTAWLERRANRVQAKV
jgi:thymidylate synthase